MKILAVSDVELSFIYSPSVTQRFADASFVISCGDLPYYYLEYIISMLNVPLYYVNGNHMSTVEYGAQGEHYAPWGATHLHRRSVRTDQGVLLSGIDGSLQYNYGPHQYSQGEMWTMVLLLTPALMINKLRYGRFLDFFVTHAPAWKIHDMEDRPHQGIKAFRWFDTVFQPAYHLHGHIHVYRQDTITETMVGFTKVINIYGYRELLFQLPGKHSAEEPPRPRLVKEEKDHA